MRQRKMGLIPGDTFNDEECRAFFKLERLGHLAVTFSAMPVIIPVPYSLGENGFLVGVSDDEIAASVGGSIVALQADGWAEDQSRRWTTLAVGPAERVSVEGEQPPNPGGIVSPGWEVAGPWTARHIFRIRPHILSGGWID